MWRIEITPVAFFLVQAPPPPGLTRYTARSSAHPWKKKGEGRKRERKRDEGREGVSEGLNVEKGEIEQRARDDILYNERKREKEIKSKGGRVRARVRKKRESEKKKGEKRKKGNPCHKYRKEQDEKVESRT